VVLRGARIIGTLNLESATVRSPLYLTRCYFDAPINLTRARLPDLHLTGCRLPALVGDQAEIDGNVDLEKSVVEVVSLAGTRVRGQVSMNGAELTAGSWPVALGTGSIEQTQGEHVVASQRLQGVAMMADQLEAEQGFYARDGFRARGTVRFAAAKIGGPLDFDGSHLGGELRIARAHIEGMLQLNDTVLAKDVACALNGNGATIDQGVLGKHLRAGAPITFVEATTATVTLLDAAIDAPLSLVGARIRGFLILTNAGLATSTDTALDAEGCNIDLGVTAEGLEAWGRVSFRNAKVSGAINLQAAEIDGALVLGGAQIEGALRLDGSLLLGTPTALDMRATKVTAACLLRLHDAPSGILDLRQAEVGRVADNLEARTATPRLRGFTYQQLNSTATEAGGNWLQRLQRRSPTIRDAKTRIEWLGRGLGGGSQPYEELSAFYRSSGDTPAARYVALRAERRRRRELTPVGKAWGYFLDVFVGYGYRPWLAAVYIGVLVTVSTFLIEAKDFSPKKDPVPTFHSGEFALDALVPVISLHQVDSYVPHSSVEGWVFFLTVIGWALTTALVAGVTAVLKRD
jgi:hypothetical protein